MAHNIKGWLFTKCNGTMEKNRPFSKTLAFKAAQTLLMLTITSSNFALAAQEEPVWVWLSNCSKKTLELQVQLDQKVIFKSSLPLCQAPRSRVNNEEQQRLGFSFKPGRTIARNGDEDTITSAADQPIEMDIWQAGAETDSLLFGVSFSTQTSVLLNTIHAAFPEKISRSELAPGLIITATPITKKSYRQAANAGVRRAVP